MQEPGKCGKLCYIAGRPRPRSSELTPEDPTAFAPPPAFGPFRVLHQIGTGALGPVFRTYEPERDRLVAVKVLRLDIPPEAARSLADELAAAASAGLFHHAIVEPVAAGTIGAAAWRAEEYVAAESLDVALRHVAPMALHRARSVVEQLAAAIDIARAAGFGHGGLHPRDVFLGGDDVRVSGFGIVNALETAGVRPPVRRPYSAPERVAGVTWATPADVFSLAAITFELLTGNRPTGHGEQFGTFEGTPAAAVEGLREVFVRAMDPDPLRRYSTATAFADALSRLDDRAAGGAGIGRAAAAGAGLLSMREEDPPAFADEDDLGDAMRGGIAGAAAPASPRHWEPVDPAGGDAAYAGDEATMNADAAADASFGDERSAGDDVVVEDAAAAEGIAGDTDGEQDPFVEDIAAERDDDEAHWSLTRDEQAERDTGDEALYSPEDEEAAADALTFDAAEVALAGAAATREGHETRDPATADEPAPLPAFASEDEDFGEDPDERPGSEEREPDEARPVVERWAPSTEAYPPPASDDDDEEDEAGEREGPEGRPSYGRLLYEEPAAGAYDAGDDHADVGMTAGAIGAGLGLSGAARAAARPAFEADAPAPTPRRPFRRFEDDEIAAPEHAPVHHAERTRPEIAPRAMMLLLGLLVGFAAGFTVAERTPSAPAPTAPTTGTAGAPAESSAAGGDGLRPVPPGTAPEPIEDAPVETPAPSVAAAPPPAAPAAAPPTPRTGQLVVRSSPSGAAVTVNGRWSGRTPLTVDNLALGAQTVRVVLDGFDVGRQQVTLSPSQASRTLTFPLRRQAAARPAPSSSAPAAAAAAAATTGALQIDSRPTGARVVVDGVPRGTTPVRVPELSAGSHTVRLELAGHAVWSTTATVEGGGTSRVAGSLEPIR